MHIASVCFCFVGKESTSISSFISFAQVSLSFLFLFPRPLIINYLNGKKDVSSNQESCQYISRRYFISAVVVANEAAAELFRNRSKGDSYVTFGENWFIIRFPFALAPIWVCFSCDPPINLPNQPPCLPPQRQPLLLLPPKPSFCCYSSCFREICCLQKGKKQIEKKGNEKQKIRNTRFLKMAFVNLQKPCFSILVHNEEPLFRRFKRMKNMRLNE